jgi:glucosamine kinase
MILIADSGTTKTEWCILADQGRSETVVTSGINPFYQDPENITSILDSEFNASKTYDAIYFYGAGCINQEKQNIVKTAILNIFGAESIFIGRDLLAAARSLCQTNPGVACILGTGSNSCYYNGSEIVDNVSPLGFILGDEGSGAVLGKILIGDILKKQLSPILINDFFDTYPTSVSEILENVYRKPFPSRYLAGYTKFHEFVTRNLLQYPGIDRKPVHFTGSIAFHFEEQLLKVIKERNLISGNIERSPMRGLVEYHISKPV